MTAFATFRDWITSHSAPRAVMAGLFAASIALMVAAAGLDAYISVPILPTVLGAGAGLALFLAAYSACLLLLPADTLANLDPKARFPLHVRRPAVIAAGVVWLIFLLMLGRHLPDVLGGTLNLAALLALFAVWTPTPEEAHAQAVALAQAQAAAEAEAATYEQVDEQTYDQSYEQGYEQAYEQAYEQGYEQGYGQGAENGTGNGYPPQP